MADEPLGEKTEDPTPKKRRESREKGNVAKSTEVNSVLVLFTGTLMLFLLGSFLYQRVNSLFYRAFSRVGDATISQHEVISIFMSSAVEFFKMILPVAGVIMMVGVLANVLQIGFLLTGKPLVPKFEKINPLSGFKRLFAIRSLVEAAKNIMKILIVGVVAFITMKGAYGDLIGLYDTSVRAIWETILMTGIHILFKV
ncbi:MAG: EscU/YscU/HrcU family type III secretion system export apparatus switch protein, partial [Chitinivibrionales bacterium]